MSENENLFSSVQMPYNSESEKYLLGGIMLDPDSMTRVIEIVPNDKYFYVKANRMIYRSMLELFTTNQPIDFATIMGKLRKIPEFKEEEYRPYLIEIGQIGITARNIADYAMNVRDTFDRRELIRVSKQNISDSIDGKENADSLIDEAEQRIFDIRQGKNIQGLVHISEVIQETYDRLDMLNSDESEELRPLSTGISTLDKYITGLNKTDLILLAARPGMGKTAFALNIASHVAVKQHKRVAFFSLEMSKEQLASRLLSSIASIESQKIKSGKMNDDEWQRLIPAGEILSHSDMYLDDTPSITVPSMKAKLRRLRNVQLVVIDYLQLLQSGRKIENRVQEISDITRNLKILAKELNVPVLALSQLSRDSEKRADHRPQLSDMRDSGSIEQDADIVLFLYRKAYYNNDDSEKDDDTDDRDAGECIVAKNRHGEMGTVHLHWSGELMRFTAKEDI